jgi:RNA polymerase sigma-70 factor (ECF subfamily)
MKVWEKKDRIEISTSVKAYLYSAVKNKMIDYIRANNKQEAAVEGLSYNELDESEAELDTMIVRQEIMKSLDRLKPKMKKIFSLSKIEGLTYGEIATYLNISKRSVEDNVAKALMILREDLKTNEVIFSNA